MSGAQAAERQADELTVLEAMFGEQLEIESAEPPVAFAVRSADATLEVRLPALYPYEPPALTLSSPRAGAGASAAAAAELQALAAAAADEECCSSIVQRFLELAEEELAAAAEPAGGTAEAPAAEEAREEAVVRIDHMNDHVSYMRSLERWAADEGLAALVLVRRSQPSRPRTCDR